MAAHPEYQVVTVNTLCPLFACARMVLAWMKFESLLAARWNAKKGETHDKMDYWMFLAEFASLSP
jgi:hypothetical protein